MYSNENCMEPYVNEPEDSLTKTLSAIQSNNSCAYAYETMDDMFDSMSFQLAR